MSGERDTYRERFINPEEGRSEIFQRELVILVRRGLLTASLSLAVTTATYAQSAYLQTGRSGWEVSGQFASGSRLNSEGVTAGYSSNGIVDAVVSISHLSFPNPYPFNFYLDSRTVAGTASSAMFSAHIVKQDQSRYPFAFCLSGGCYLGSFSAPASQNATETRVDNGYICYGGSIYLINYVNPLIGTANGGSIYPGPPRRTVWSSRVRIPTCDIGWISECGQGRNRTADTRIFSPYVNGDSELFSRLFSPLYSKLYSEMYSFCETPIRAFG